MVGGNRRLEFWGVRGTVATPAADRLRFGGNTSCLAVQLSDSEHLVLDCGTGARRLGKAIEAGRGGREARVNILFSHYHLDHTEGLSLFAPLYAAGNRVRIHGMPPDGRTLKETFETLIAPPYFPVPIAEAKAAVEYVELDGTPVDFGHVSVRTLPLNHPGGSTAFGVDRGSRRIVYATDHEHGDPATDAAFQAFVRGADVLIYDATYLPEEYEAHRGWGHSTWEQGVAVARAAGVGKLVLFHHDPDRDDDDLDALLGRARAEFPSTDLAREGDAIAL
jgi:phosphoribosyl 1,2-cyclic phosphodiesterase